MRRPTPTRNPNLRLEKRTPDTGVEHFIADVEGERLDQAVARLRGGLSRSRGARLIDSGHVLVNGSVSKSSSNLHLGDRIDVDIPVEVKRPIEAQSIPISVLYQDEDLLVVDKPAGIVVHPAPGHDDGTLVNGLLALDPELRVGESHRPGLVHRLDQDTSGVMVIARNDRAMKSLQDQWASRRVIKVYRALTVGIPANAQAIIDAPIGRDPRNRERMAIVNRGRDARTDYSTIERFKGFAFLELRIWTGRTHQIRVHLASIGHPIVGDLVYGRAGLAVDRQMLHAWRLTFDHPTTGQEIIFEAPMPADFEDALSLLRSASP